MAKTKPGDKLRRAIPRPNREALHQEFAKLRKGGPHPNKRAAASRRRDGKAELRAMLNDDSLIGQRFAELARLLNRDLDAAAHRTLRLEGRVKRKQKTFAVVEIDRWGATALAHESDSEKNVVRRLKVDERVRFFLVCHPTPGEYAVLDVELIL